jgi:hypothetical protein
MDLRELINVSYRSVTAEQLGSVVDTITDLAIYARMNHITAFNIIWRPFQNSFGVTHLTTSQYGANQSITSRDNFYAEVAKLKLPTEWPETMPAKVRIGFDYLELYFAGAEEDIYDLVRTHLADLPDQLLARGIHGVKFTWQPKENIAQILTVSMTGKYLTNGIRLARPFITNLTAIEKWPGPKTITINIENKEITFVGASHE